MAIDITLQYFHGCPNWKIAEQDISVAIGNLGLDAEVRHQKIESHDEAERLHFRGSSTILVSGKDPFADENAPVGLSCRVYRTGEGQSGSPGIASLERALSAEY